MSFNQTELSVLRWGEARGIVQNSTAKAQAMKTLEEVGELLTAIGENDMAEIKDAVGDIVVTLVMVCATLDVSLPKCFAGSFEQIKDRTGYLRPDGVFVKDAK